MARSHICQNPCQNLLFIGKDKLADGILTLNPAVSHVSTPDMSCASIFSFVLAPSLNSGLFKHFMKTYLGVQTQFALSKAWEETLNRCLKVRNFGLYYKKNATIFIIIARTISRRLVLRVTIIYFLQFYSFGKRSTSASKNIRTGLNMIRPLPLLEINLKHFSEKFLENQLHFWIASEIRSKKRLISIKKTT